MKITCKFQNPIDWEHFKELDLPGIIAITYGGSKKIHAFRCEEGQLTKIAEILDKRKIAFNKQTD